jgi:hypothetical protein
MTRKDNHHSAAPWATTPAASRRLPARLRSRAVLTVPPAPGTGSLGDRPGS